MNHILFRSLLLLMLSGTAALAQEHSAQKTVSKRYPVNRETTLEVQNKYGKIEVVSWDKDSVGIEVDLHLTESSASKLRKLKEDISIGFSRSGDYIVAKSKFKNENGRLSQELKSVGHAISGTNKHVEINYRIYLPDYLTLVLVNKFGDIYMDSHAGHLDIELSNGVLKANVLEGISNVDINFGNGMIQSLGSSTLRLTYSDITLGDAGQLDLYSKSSKLKADSVNVLKIDSRRDKLHFQRVEYLYGTSSFTEVWVYDFLRESDLYMKYGKLTIEHVYPDFSKIHVKSDYADVALYFDKESAFAFDILHHEKAVLRMPGDETKASENYDGKDHFRTTGTMGGKDPDRKVTIDALQKCYINLSYK